MTKKVQLTIFFLLIPTALLLHKGCTYLSGASEMKVFQVKEFDFLMKHLPPETKLKVSDSGRTIFTRLGPGESKTTGIFLTRQTNEKIINHYKALLEENNWRFGSDKKYRPHQANYWVHEFYWEKNDNWFTLKVYPINNLNQSDKNQQDKNVYRNSYWLDISWT